MNNRIKFILSLYTILCCTFCFVVNGQDLLMECATFSSVNNNIELTWRNDYNCAAAFDRLIIYTSDQPSTGFTELTRIDDPSDNIHVHANPPNDTMYYYIQMLCTDGNLSPVSDTVSSEQLAPPEILSASVNVDGTVTITWEPNTEPNAEGYIIYETENAISTHSLSGASVNSFIDPNMQDSISIYDMTTVDFCGNSGLLYDTKHHTMWLTAENDLCETQVRLSWHHYIGWDEIERYEIIKSGTTTPVDTVSRNDSTFVYSYNLGDNFELQIKAVKKDDSRNIFAFSNSININSTIDLPTGYVYLSKATVEDDQSVLLEWFIDPSSSAKAIHIMRARETEDLEKINSLNAPTISPLMSYNDATANTRKFVHEYRVDAEDNCEELKNSEIGKTILLNGRDLLNQTNRLNWTQYYIPFATVNSYNILRKDNGTYAQLTNVLATDSIFVDENAQVLSTEGAYCYKIEAEYTLSLPNGTTRDLKANSNEFCIGQSSSMIMPNAFNPTTGDNFQPVFIFPNEEDYSMIIVNRWGEKVFETTDLSEGWDGVVRNDLAPQGVYAYVVRMRSYNGNLIKREGTVLLLR